MRIGAMEPAYMIPHNLKYHSWVASWVKDAQCNLHESFVGVVHNCVWSSQCIKNPLKPEKATVYRIDKEVQKPLYSSRISSNTN